MPQLTISLWPLTTILIIFLVLMMKSKTPKK